MLFYGWDHSLFIMWHLLNYTQDHPPTFWALIKWVRRFNWSFVDIWVRNPFSHTSSTGFVLVHYCTCPCEVFCSMYDHSKCVWQLLVTSGIFRFLIRLSIYVKVVVDTLWSQYLGICRIFLNERTFLNPWSLFLNYIPLIQRLKVLLGYFSCHQGWICQW